MIGHVAFGAVAVEAELWRCWSCGWCMSSPSWSAMCEHDADMIPCSSADKCTG